MLVTETDALEQLFRAGVLVMLRLGSALVTMPVFSSPGIPARVKAVMVLALTIVITPTAAYQPHADATLSGMVLVSEVLVGLCFGVTLMLLTEAMLFGASLMSSAFSFSLANLMDPNSQVETEVMGTLLNWFGVLVLVTAGLHRTMLAALLRTFATVPLGHVFSSLHSGEAFAGMASGIFLAGLQLAAPVIAAALLVEVAVGLVSRMAPAMPAQIASVPVKTMVSYTILIGGLALWPLWIERHFTAFLDMAQRNLRA
jgi:flagellar biosynthetic protein FliR